MTASNLRARWAYRTAMELALQNISTPLTLTHLRGITPHLSDDQFRFLNARVNSSNERVHIATPGLEVADSYFIVALRPATDGPVQFTISKAKRCTVCDPSREAMFAQEALEYARENWGAELGSASAGKYHRVLVPDVTLLASGLPVLRGDATVVHFISSTDSPVTTPEGASTTEMLDAHIVRIFEGEIESLEHCSEQLFRNPNRGPLWEVTEIPAKVLAHLTRQAARQAA
jgi:hypothetical protein